MKIKLCCGTHDFQSEEEDIMSPDELGLSEDEIKEMSEDTKKTLEEAAEDFFWNTKEPGWWFEIIEAD